MKNSDLHTHSYYSDGELSPKELVKLAKRRRIKYLALTDHDSVEGVAEALKEGERIGVNVIPAVEIGLKKGEILAYFIDTKNKKLLAELKRARKITEDGVKLTCDILRRKGYDISFAKLQKAFPKSKHNLNFAFILFYLHNKKIFEDTHEAAREIKRLKKGKKKKPKKKKRITAIRVIRLIRQAGGVPVLAHPWLSSNLLKPTTFRRLVKAGLKGIEINNGDSKAFMAEVSEDKNITSTIRKLATKYNLIITRGTDFHGKHFSKIAPGKHDLGDNNCDQKVVKQLEQATQ